MKTKITFIIIPILIIIALNYSLSSWKHINNSWYNGLNTFVKTNHELNILFIGSSRVAASVDTQHFKELYKEKFHKDIQAFNLGKGFSTLKQNYFILRNLLEDHPRKLQNLTVFIEAPDGLPELIKKDEKWFHLEQPAFLIDVLRQKDLSSFVESKMSFDDKVQILIKYLTKPFLLLRYQETIRNGLLANGIILFKKLFGLKKLSKPKKADLVTMGNIRNDLDGVQKVRKNALKLGLQRIKNQKASAQYKDSSIYEIQKLLSQYGAKLVFFHMPVSSIYKNDNLTKLRMKERQIFNKELNSHKDIQVIKSNINFSDTAFPDLLHLAKSKRKEFTNKIFTSFY